MKRFFHCLKLVQLHYSHKWNLLISEVEPFRQQCLKSCRKKVVSNQQLTNSMPTHIIFDRDLTSCVINATSFIVFKPKHNSRNKTATLMPGCLIDRIYTHYCNYFSGWCWDNRLQVDRTFDHFLRHQPTYLHLHRYDLAVLEVAGIHICIIYLIITLCIHKARCI